MIHNHQYWRNGPFLSLLHFISQDRSRQSSEQREPWWIGRRTPPSPLRPQPSIGTVTVLTLLHFQQQVPVTYNWVSSKSNGQVNVKEMLSFTNIALPHLCVMAVRRRSTAFLKLCVRKGEIVKGCHTCPMAEPRRMGLTLQIMELSRCSAVRPSLSNAQVGQLGLTEWFKFGKEQNKPSEGKIIIIRVEL